MKERYIGQKSDISLILLFLALFIFLFSIVGVLVFFYDSGQIPFSGISEDDLSKGAIIYLYEGENELFYLSGTEYNFTVIEVYPSFVTFSIPKKDISVSLIAGRNVSLDFNRDGTYDLNVKLLDIRSGRASFELKRTYEKIQ
jgi:hypothetical protein